jgi:lipopolysaccharide biosynthesis regulator YciM
MTVTYLLYIGPIILIGVMTAMALAKRRSRPRETAKESYMEGLRLLTNGDEQTAFIKFRQAVDQDTNNIDAYLKMGDIFRNRGFVEKALQVHRELTMRRDIPQDIETEINKSLVLDYIKGGKKDKAYEILNKIVKNVSSRYWASEQLLELFIKDQKWKEACDIYEDILKKGSHDGHIRLANLKILFGRSIHDGEEYHKARIVYKEALSLNKDNPLSYLYIAESYLEEKRIEDGLEFLKKLCDDVPIYAHLAFPLIEETLFQLGRYGEVEDIYRNILSHNANNNSAKIALAGILEKKGELSSAEGLLKSALDSDPTNSLAALRLVNIMASKDRIDDGLEILSEVAAKIYLNSQEFKCRKCGKGLSRPLPVCPDCGSVGTFI